MTDPVGAHITRIFVNCPRSSPSPIRSTKSVPVCTSTPITTGNQPNPSPQQKMALIAKEMINSQRSSDPAMFHRKSPISATEIFQFVAKDTRQTIDFNNVEQTPRPDVALNEKLSKKKKKRQTIAVVPPTIESALSTKANDDGDNLVPLTMEMKDQQRKKKTNFTSYDGVQMFTFTLDDD